MWHHTSTTHKPTTAKPNALLDSRRQKKAGGGVTKGLFNLPAQDSPDQPEQLSSVQRTVLADYHQAIATYTLCRMKTRRHWTAFNWWSLGMSYRRGLKQSDNKWLFFLSFWSCVTGKTVTRLRQPTQNEVSRAQGNLACSGINGKAKHFLNTRVSRML